MEQGEIPRTQSPGDLTPTSPTSNEDESKRMEEDRPARDAAGAEVEREEKPRSEVAGATGRGKSSERQPHGEGHGTAPTTKDAIDGEGGDSPIPDRNQVAGDETQWREGHDLVIERKVGPGGDVCHILLSLSYNKIMLM